MFDHTGDTMNLKFVSVLGVTAALSLGTLVSSAPVSARTYTTYRTRTVMMSGMGGHRMQMREHMRMAEQEDMMAARARRRGNLRTARRHEAMARYHRRMARQQERMMR